MSLSLFPGPVMAQTYQCPYNIDFESGTLDNWQPYTGSCCPIYAQTKGTGPGMFTIVSGNGTDPYGKFPLVPPGAGKYTLKLGNEKNGAKSERVRYYLKIPAGAYNYCLNYKFAFVYRDKLSHGIDVQPRFEMRVTDSISGALINCEEQRHIPFWYNQGIRKADSGSLVYYKPWTDATINLSGCEGQTVAIDFAAAGCDEGGHFGYAYFDLSCSVFKIRTVACPGQKTATLFAPKGYFSYDWRDSSLQRLLLGKSDSLVVPVSMLKSLFYVMIKPFDGATCNDTLTALLEVNELQAAFSMSDSMQCLDQNRFVFDNLSWVFRDSLSYEWDFGDSVISTLKSPEKKYDVAGKFRVFLSVVSVEGCRDTFQNELEVVSRPVSGYHVPDSAQCLAINNFNFNTDAASGRKYAWDLGDGTSGSSVSVNHAYKLAGTYAVTLVITDLGICADTVSGTVEVYPQADLSFAGDTICLDKEVSLEAKTGSFAGNIMNYSWSLGDQSVLSGNPANHYYAMPGSYDVMLRTVTDKGCVDSLLKPGIVIVHGMPVADFDYEKVLDSFPVTLMRFVDLSNGSGRMKYDWQFGPDGKSAEQFPVYAFSDTGTVNIKLMIQDSFGCMDEAEKWIRLQHDFSIFVPGVFTPNGDGVNEIFRPEGLQNFTTYEMRIFNTWGELLFVSGEWADGWDGTYKGAPCQQGIYLCVIQARSINKELHNYGLQVTLLR